MIPHNRIAVACPEIDAAVAALRAGRLSQGEEVAALEARLSDLFDGAHVVATSSGTASLYVALAALNCGPGHSVVIPSYTCNSLYAAVSHVGSRPVLADLGDERLAHP